MRGGIVYVLAAFAAASAAVPARATEPWIGRWAVDPAACLRDGSDLRHAALTVRDTTLSWFDRSCRVGKIYKVGNAAFIQAHCSGRTETTPISLTPDGARMRVTWDGVRQEEMRKCP